MPITAWRVSVRVGDKDAMTDDSGDVESCWPFYKRLWQYQKERFPLVAHAPLVLLFSGAACAYSRALRGEHSLPSIPQWGLAFGLCLGFFFLLRVADEVKDREIDETYQPERPIPRGLISLREVVIVGVLVGCIQGIVAATVSAKILLVLLAGWIYFAAMSAEFGVGAWLRRQPLLYLLSHMGVMPLVDWLATACDWATALGQMPDGLGAFLAASYCNGVVIEVGRKIKAPSAEREGVDTYSAVWGPWRAVLAWALAMAATGACAGMAAVRVGMGPVVGIALGVVAVLALAISIPYLRQPERGGAFEVVSGLWTAALYGSIMAGVATLT